MLLFTTHAFYGSSIVQPWSLKVRSEQTKMLNEDAATPKNGSCYDNTEANRKDTDVAKLSKKESVWNPA
ncbi:hypothetical protein SKAU_G00261900 [Synaphobranchus kaupii]|uniref:Uncharacterized protein n=1 Tax=Synaphobranchus kaupii TaxID=118154 RepID=A0A9Q1EYN4_SYNKA|nr:hypothetical protein SKAU_G00261900 [Synaphobranchus kaupii]